MKKAGIVKVMCYNCHYERWEVKDEAGTAKMLCPCCGTRTVLQVASRRHIQIDIYAPQGQVIIEN